MVGGPAGVGSAPVKWGNLARWLGQHCWVRNVVTSREGSGRACKAFRTVKATSYL